MREATDVIRWMRNTPLFDPLPEEGVVLLARQGCYKSFESGAHLIEENGNNAFLFLITRGEVKVVANGTEVDRQRAGDTAGEVSMSKISPPVADVIAIGEVEAILFPGAAIDEAGKTFPDFARRLRETGMKKVYDR